MIRTQQASDGILTTWKYDDSLGNDYTGPKVVCTRTKKKIPEWRRLELLASEERTKEMDRKIRNYKC